MQRSRVRSAASRRRPDSHRTGIGPPGGRARWLPRLLSVLVPAALLLAGCAAPSNPARVPEARSRPDEPGESASAPRIAALWSRSCALCHVNGEGGAPRLGNAAEWQPRLAQGNDALLQHTLEGFNNMPPLGYCMSCEREDFEALIQFMTGHSMTGAY